MASQGGSSAPARDLGFVDAPLGTLVGEAIGALRVAARLMPATIRGVSAYWSRWERWAHDNGWVAFPAEAPQVLLFAAARADEGIAPNTLRANLRAIQQVHDDNSVPTVGFTRIAAEIVAGLERTRSAPRRRAPVIPVLDLFRMARLSADRAAWDLAALRDHVMLLVGYAGGLRLVDLARARLECLERVSTGYVLRANPVRVPDGRGGGVLLAAREDDLDPVAAIDRWRDRTGLDMGPLLPALPTNGPGRPISTATIRARLQDLARRAGCTVRPTGGSLRRSWATHAYEAGIDLLSINRHLRQRHHDSGRAAVTSLSPWPGNPALRLAAAGGSSG